MSVLKSTVSMRGKSVPLLRRTNTSCGLRGAPPICCLNRPLNTQASNASPMTRDTRIFLLMMGEPVAALCANDPGAFECWLSGSVQDLGELQSEKIVRRNAGNILMAEMKFF